ncbi:MAG: thioredoxin [Bdellovibrionales bacterium RIFCSPHIGHO2_01_FULL_40_29]|nr:MAG: thioredoxin [Bdellovibrionales bacterium RIFCSPHIGHO2_01_FULL_40_29]OFZ32682.1 MAG: thioredoxin [Bdellovibrionales bacterium RIFCSPHIGHO2_02_FULL_40_15]
MGQFTKAVTDTSFDQDVVKSSDLVLVDFWAEWCGPCRALAPKLEEIASEMGSQVKVLKMNVDENPQTPGQFGIRGIPAMLLFKNGKQVGELVGNQPKESITQFLKSHI